SSAAVHGRAPRPPFSPDPLPFHVPSPRESVTGRGSSPLLLAPFTSLSQTRTQPRRGPARGRKTWKIELDARGGFLHAASRKHVPPRDGAMPNPSEFTRQAAAIPIKDGMVCLITSSNGKRWVIPKGLIDPGHTAGESALLESWEEAGLVG